VKAERRTSRALAASAAALLLLAACGGDDDGGSSSTASPGDSATQTAAVATASNEEAAYYEQLEVALQTSAADATALNDFRAQVFDPAKGEEERRQGALDLGEQFVQFNTARDQAIRALTPSALVAELHDALAGASSDALTLAGDLNGRIQEDPPLDQAAYNALLTELDAVTVTARFRDACTSLQSRAQDKGIEADLACNS
jgi:hypothetical protein